MTTTSAVSAPGDITTKQSPFSVEETLRRLEDIIRERGLTEFAHFDHSGEAAKVGLTMQPAHVLAFGNPRAGTPLMVASPLIALELPLRVLVWQDAAGQVCVSYRQPAALAERYSLPADLTRVLAAVEAIVEATLTA